MDGLSEFSPRRFLRDREALLIHFNTPMSVNHPTGFPDDLRQASGLKGTPLSFSTIQGADQGPWQGGDLANAGGSVGVIVDIKETGSVISVGPGDDGTKAQSDGNHQTGGSPPSADACAKSIDDRLTANEWFVQDFVPLGIFVFLPARVFVRSAEGTFQGEREATLDEILAAFPNQRMFGSHAGAFLEYIRTERRSRPVEYPEIVRP